MFRLLDKNLSFETLDHKILKFWDQNLSFKKSLNSSRFKEEDSNSNSEYIFFDGPPFATGLPHYGHLLAGTIKDILPRYWSMKGKKVERRFGWDCHGLPIESLIQNELKLSGNQEIEDYGVDKFNEACRSSVFKYTDEWRAIVTCMGRWVDFEDDYKTMDLSFMESVWWVFQQCFKKKLIYSGYKVQPYSPSLGTPLSNFETNQGYRDRQDPSLTVQFQLSGKDEYFLVWTTTPWTLPSNLAIAVNAKIKYVLVEVGGKKYWLSESKLSFVFPKDESVVLETKQGKDLVGKKYQTLFSYAPLQSGKQYTIIAAKFVTDGDGTGFVHIAPSFGEDDFNLGKEEGLGLFDPLDDVCRFTEEVSEWKGLSVKEADKSIIKYLKEAGSVFKHDTFVHSYPHCYRTDVPLIYRAVKTWFLNVNQNVTSDEGITKTLKEWMIDCNEQINWVPDHVKKGRFGKWLEGAKDWNLSRNRFWGTPIPIWVAKDGDLLCVGSIDELKALANQQEIQDLHKHFVDDLVISTSDKKTYDVNGKKYYRTSEVLDCWFESGSMPYAQKHYPFENKKEFENNFPADFIAEGLDQTRGWFYTLIVISASLWQKPAFKNVIINGIILAEDGQKMSKRLQNYPDPNTLISKIGADAIRLFMINSNAVKAGSLKFSEEGGKEMIRSVLLPLWNSLNLFVTYANADLSKNQLTWKPGIKINSKNVLDQWIISTLQLLLKEVQEEMEQYHLYKVVPAILKFIDDLTNWYIRRSRRRFWKSENDDDKNQAYSTLYEVLVTLSQLAAPILPFLCEEIYQILVGELNLGQPDSVHLCKYPVCDEKKINHNLVYQVQLTREAVNLARTIRNERQIKNKQPLESLKIIVESAEREKLLLPTIDMIKDEINVKQVLISMGDSDLIQYEAKANFKTLGKRMGKNMQAIAGMISNLSHAQIADIYKGNIFETDFGTLGINDLLIEKKFPKGMSVKVGEKLIVALDLTLSEALISEGLAREYINRIQNTRKTMGLQVTDNIEVYFYSESKFLLEVAKNHQKYICDEVLALSSQFLNKKEEITTKSFQEEISYEGEFITFSIKNLN